MPFYARINDAISQSSRALNMLASYNHHRDPASEPNRSIRNDARLTIDPTIDNIRRGVDEGRYEFVSSRQAHNALGAVNELTNATWSLSHYPNPRPNQPANVSLAQSQIRAAISLLQQARW